MTNVHSGDGTTSAVFITKEQREAGVDPATVANRIGAATQVTNNHGVQVQMVNKGRSQVAQHVAPSVLYGFEALRFAINHPGTMLTRRDPASGLLGQHDPQLVFANGLPTEQELNTYHVQTDALGRPLLPTALPDLTAQVPLVGLLTPTSLAHLEVSAPPLTGAPRMSAPSGTGGLGLMEQAPEVVEHIPAAHSMTAFQRPAGNVPHVRIRELVAPIGTRVTVHHSGPHVRIRLAVPVVESEVLELDPADGATLVPAGAELGE